MIRSISIIIKLTMRRMKSIKKLFYWIIVADIFLIAFSMSRSKEWLISSQAAFISSLSVTFASFYAYKNMISKKISSKEGDYEIDKTEEILDEFELFEDEKDKRTHEDIKDLIKEERKNFSLKKSASAVVQTFKAIISPFRVGAYLFLILLFLYINRHGYLEIWGYISGLLVVPLIVSLFGKRSF